MVTNIHDLISMLKTEFGPSYLGSPTELWMILSMLLRKKETEMFRTLKKDRFWLRGELD